MDKLQRSFPDLHPASDAVLRATVVSGWAGLVDIVRTALRDELNADVTEVTAFTHGRPADLVVAEIATEDPAPLIASVRAGLPHAALLVLAGRNVLVSHPALGRGVDGLIALESATLPDPYAVAAAARSALGLRSERVAAERYRHLAVDLLDSTTAAACLVDPDGRILAVNRHWPDFVAANGGEAATTGAGADYLQDCWLATGTDPSTREQVAHGLRAVLGGDIEGFELEYRWDSPEVERWFRLEIAPLPTIGGARLAHHDISLAKQTAMALSHLTLHDPLTELPNRALLHDRLSRALTYSARLGLSVAVALFDLDQFKRINESWGHAAGDELLRLVAQRFEDDSLGIDTTSRVADDEFVALRQSVETELEAEQWAHQLATVFDEPFVLTGVGASVSVTASIGLSMAQPDDEPDDLLQRADVAMHAAKSDGRGRVRLYTDDLGRGAQSRLRTEQELRAGIAAGEFTLFYQPVIDLRLRKVVGVEALLRWRHPDGLRMPDTFIPIAEDTGLIVPLGGWVVEEACRQAVAWNADKLDLEMAVNLSARQVSHPDTIATIEAALHAAALDPSRLLVEVTESAVVEDAEAAQQALAQVAALGVRIAIDDFGTGYSSLLYLKRYPIQALKVDRTFVSGLGISDDDDAIVASVVSLARAVGAVCIAEGVETHEQHAFAAGTGMSVRPGLPVRPPGGSGRAARPRRGLRRAAPAADPARGRRPDPASAQGQPRRGASHRRAAPLGRVTAHDRRRAQQGERSDRPRRPLGECHRGPDHRLGPSRLTAWVSRRGSCAAPAGCRRESSER